MLASLSVSQGIWHIGRRKVVRGDMRANVQD